MLVRIPDSVTAVWKCLQRLLVLLPQELLLQELLLKWM